MNGKAWKLVAVLAAASGATVAAQQTRAAGTLVIAGQPEQAQLVRINGKSYVDVESLARMTHGTLRFEGTRTILTLPAPAAGSPNTAGAAPDTAKPPRLTEAFLGAEIEALTQVREWHVSLVNAVNNNYPVTSAWVSPMQRQAEAKLQLAVAAATSEPDHQAAQLLRAEFTNMQQISDQLLAMHDKASYISPDIFSNNMLDAKVLGCEQALAAMAATKQYQDETQCH
ncbi:MAG TPA: hypothetical protein VN612_12695 [Acidobacteriaceae bacterium]|nr:hypothetical protein [Acidobacteriaceae bacterium]